MYNIQGCSMRRGERPAVWSRFPDCENKAREVGDCFYPDMVVKDERCKPCRR